MPAFDPLADFRKAEFDGDGKLVNGFDLSDPTAPAGAIVLSGRAWGELISAASTLRYVSGFGDDAEFRTEPLPPGPGPEDAAEQRFENTRDLAVIVEMLVELGHPRPVVIAAIRTAGARVDGRPPRGGP